MLYHNVLTIERLKSILKKNVLLKMDDLECVCLTRDINYLKSRGIRIVFDKTKLKYNYKIKPFSYRGYCILNNRKFIPRFDECEERVYNDINIIKTCIRIDIDKNKYNIIDIKNDLINHTYDF